MLLAERDFAVFVANFEDKATNIARIAQELDLDVSSIAFLDDNPAERERVRSALPWAMVPEVGDDPAGFGRALVASGYFEHPPLTTDDRRRAEAYRARAEAKALQATIGDYAEYLRSLDMEMTISLFDALGRARIAQLVQKSNQFNLTTIRYSEAEIAEIEGDAMRLGWQVRLKDRFADHGMISVVVVEKNPAEWRVETWIMSCRVIERGVEQAVMSRLADCAKRAGAEALTGEYRPTARNALVRDFYPKLGFAAAEGATPPAQRYRLALATVRFPPSAISSRDARSREGRALIVAVDGLEFHHLGVACERIAAEIEVWAGLGYRPEGEAFVDAAQGVRGLFMVGGGPRIRAARSNGKFADAGTVA